MSKVQIDWEQARQRFWENLDGRAPRTRRSLDWVVFVYERVWKEVNPVVGLEDAVSISISKEGKLVASLSGWLLLGALALAAQDKTIEQANKEGEENLRQLRQEIERLKEEIKDLKDRLEIR